MSVFDMQAKSGGGGEGSEVPPQGSHPAACVAIIDLGTHDEEFKGKKTTSHKIYVVWELTAERMSGADRNHTIGTVYTAASTPSANLRKMLEKWRGRPYNEGEPFDLRKVVGASCIVTIGHKTSAGGNVYATMDGVMQPIRGMTVPPAKLAPFFYDLGEGEIPAQPWLPDVYLGGQFGSVAETIRRSHEMRGKTRDEFVSGKPAVPANGAAHPPQQPQHQTAAAPKLPDVPPPTSTGAVPF